TPLHRTFMKLLAFYWPEADEHAQQLEGIASLQTDITYRPSPSALIKGDRIKVRAPDMSAWSHNLHWQLHHGKLRHPQLPIPMEEIEAAGHCLEGRFTLERLTALAGGARIKMDGVAKGLTIDSDFLANVTIDNLNLTPELFDRLP